MSFLRGGAVFACALLTASVVFNARPLAAESKPIDQNTSTNKSEENVPSVGGKKPGALSLPIPADAPDLTPPELPSPDYSFGRESLAVAPSDNNSKKNLNLLISRPPSPTVSYIATAYSLTGRTASGLRPVTGMIAADPAVLPLGTRVRVDAGSYSGEYTVTDSGGRVRGHRIDVWVPNTREAFRFGKRNVRLTVLNYGGRRRVRSR